MELSAPVERPVASLHSEAVGLLSTLQKVEVRYNGHVQLMIFIDFWRCSRSYRNGDRVIFGLTQVTTSVTWYILT